MRATSNRTVAFVCASLVASLVGKRQGDADGNGIVDRTDLLIVLSNLGREVSAGTQGDITGDGAVDEIDLVRMLELLDLLDLGNN